MSTHSVGENISQSYIWLDSSIQKKDHLQFNNIKTNNTPKKMDKGLEQTFLHRRYMNGQQAHEKPRILVIREMQNHNETSLHTQ